MRHNPCAAGAVVIMAHAVSKMHGMAQAVGEY